MTRFVSALCLFVLGAATAFAAERTLNFSGTPVAVQDLSGEVDVYFTSMRLNRALNVWNVEVTVRNKGSRELNGPFALYVESFSGTTGLIQPDGMDGQNAYLDLAGVIPSQVLGTNQSSAPRTLSLGNNGGTPQLNVRVYGHPQPSGYALGLSRSLNEVGQPLPDVVVEEVGPGGVNTNSTDAALGLITLGKTTGTHVWKFRKPGYVPVWRRGVLSSNEVTVVANPRLTPIGTNRAVFTPIAGGTLTTTGLQINFGPGAFAQNTTGTVTRLTGQTLPAFLPLGWSPLQAFAFDLNAIPNSPATVNLTPWGRIAPSESVVLVRWNELSLTWDALQTTSGSTNLQFAIPGAGIFAVVVADTGTFAPPAPESGQPLLGSTGDSPVPLGDPPSGTGTATRSPVAFSNTSASPISSSGSLDDAGRWPALPVASLSAVGTVTPSLSPASRNPELVTASTEVTITNIDGALPSGIVLRCEVSETYDLADDTRRVLPRYESFIVAYQRPGDANPNTVVANFPLRPLLLLSGDELKQGNVRVDVIEPTSFGGGVFDDKGGQVAAGGVRILAAAGVFTNRLAIDLRLLDKTNFVALAGSNIVYAFELSLGQLADGKRLAAQFAAQTPNSFFVLARVISRNGIFGLEPVERFLSDATGKLNSVEPSSGERLPGITSGGQFVLIRLNAPQGLLSGMARNIGGQAVAAIPVRVVGQPWLTFSRDGGVYRLIAPTGTVEVVVTDIATGDSTTGTVALNNWQTGATLNISAVAAGPRVVSISPANGSTNVALVNSVTITFSEPVNVGSAVGNVLLLASVPTNGSSSSLLPPHPHPLPQGEGRGEGEQNVTSSSAWVVVNASLNFNLRGNVATLLPTEALAADTIHQLWLGTNITDLAGYKLEGTNVFVFKTQRETLDRGVGAQLISHEPTNGVVFMRASQGMAEPGQPVILVNENSGETTTVLANTDGSFEGTIRASVDDFLNAVFVNANGTRNTVPVNRQVFADGSVGLFKGGGAIELQGENGPIEITVEPGAIANKTKFKFESVPLTNVLTLLSNVQPEGGKVFGGIRARPITGDIPSQSLDFKFPLKPEQLEGINPTNATFALCVARTVEGEQVFEIVDRMHYENGALVTHSPPFFGFLPGYELIHDLLITPIMMSLGTSRPVAGHVYAARVYNTGRPIEGTEQYLPGALVSVRPASSPHTPGRLRAGTVYAGTDARGYYSTLVSINAFDPNRALAVRATHPRFRNFEAIAGMPEIDPTSPLDTVIYPHDVVFPLQSEGNDVAPEISISHGPEYPPTNSFATLNVVATDNSSRPNLLVQLLSVQPVIPGMRVGTADVYEGDREVTEIGTTGIREVRRFASMRPLRATFRVKASDQDGNDRDLTYQITFGVRPPPATNDIPASDPNDKTGPQVVSSVPSRDSSSLAPGDAIIISFNEPVDRSLLNDPSAISISPDAGTPNLLLSPDQHVLSLEYGLLKPDTEYTLTLNTTIKDISGNALDQNLTRDGNDSYTLTFKTAPLRVTNLPLEQQGAGAIVRGNYAFVLERRGTANGALVVFSLENPAAPREVAREVIPAWPRDMVLIPNWSFKRRADTNVIETKDLLAIVGGLAGLGNSQTLRVFDISNPLDPQWLIGAALRNDGASIVNKIQWAPPMLAYQENGPIDSVSVVDLQTMILVEYMSREEFRELPPHGEPGEDYNFDGDYVDLGDTNTPPDKLPVPERLPTEFSGKIGAYIASQTFQGIGDFAVANRGDLIGVILDAGAGMKPDGTRSETNYPPAYRTIYSAGIGLDPAASTFYISNGLPRRVTFLTEFPLSGSNGVSFVDLALVSVRAPVTGETNSVLVLDITDRNGPKLLSSIPIPATFGDGVFSIRPREDGMLLLATERDLVILHPGRLHLPVDANGQHPAIVGIIPGGGESLRTFGESPNGIFVTAAGGKNIVVQSAPKMQFVYFPSVRPFLPDALATLPKEQIAERMAQAEATTFLQPGRFRTVGDCATSTLTGDLSPDSHYYVLVRAPGGAGASIDLALESLSWAGTPLSRRGLLFPPVHALSDFTLRGMGFQATDEDAPVRALKAWRVSNDPNSEFYNYYLSRPFALTYEEMSKTELAQLKGELDREILWSGANIRASIDPGMRDNPVLGLFASKIDPSDRTMRPGVEALALGFEADYIQSPNPGPIAGGMTIATALNVISAHNSELVMDAVDMELPGRRLPLVFRRNYSGQGIYDGPFGRGWDFNFNQRLIEISEFAIPPGRKFPLACASVEPEVAEGNDLLFYTGAGRVIGYKFAGTNPPPEIANDPLVQKLGWTNRAAAYYLPPLGAFSPMLKFRDGRFVKLDPDGVQHWYNSAGRLAKIYDRYDTNSLEMVYNRRGELIRILDDVRRPVEIGYWRLENDVERRPNIDVITTNPRIAGKIAKIEDYSKRDVLFFYTSDGLLERREGFDVEVATVSGFRGRQITRYAYSAADAPNRTGRSLIGIVGNDRDGTPLMMASQLGNRGRDTVGMFKVANAALEIEQAHANTTDALRTGEPKTKVKEPGGAVTEYKFDSFGRAKEFIYSGAVGAPLTNKVEYYTNGLLKSVMYPEGNSVEYVFDSENPSLRSRANIVKVTKRPGPRGGPVLEAMSQFNPLYNIAEGPKTDFNGTTAIITLTLDKRDAERIAIGSDAEEFGVNEYGQIARRKTVDGVEHKWEYTDKGFLLRQWVGEFAHTYSYAPNSGARSDATLRGLPSQIIDANGIPTDFFYNERNQIVRQVRDGVEVTFTYDQSGNAVETKSVVEPNKFLIEKKVYNQVGFLVSNVVSEVETDGAVRDLVTTYKPDDLNRIKEAIYPGGDRHILDYDHAGRVWRYTVEGAYQETYAYDANGNQTNRTYGTASETFIHDGHDRLKRIITAVGTTIDFNLDNNGNLLGRTVRDKDGTLLSEVTHTVDEHNRTRTTSTKRDDGEAVVRVDFFPNERRTVVTDALGVTSTTTHDLAGRVVRTESPTETIAFEYDGNNNLKKRTVEDGRTYIERYNYNARNQLTNIVDNAGVASSWTVGFDGRALVLRDRMGYGVTNRYTILGETLERWNANGIHTRFTYDANRHVTAIRDRANRGVTSVIDAQGRETQSRLPNNALSTYSSFNALTLPEHAELPRSISVDSRYDVDGLLTNRVITSADGPWREAFSYDGLRRPTLLSDPNGSVSMRYDLQGWVKEWTTSYRFLASNPPMAQLDFAVSQKVNAGGFRTELNYPANAKKLTYRRENTGRLLGLEIEGAENVISDTVYAGDDLVGRQVLGANRIAVENSFNELKRPTARRYTRLSDGATLVDVRYGYDKNGGQIARQHAHRAGRTEFFTYDAGYRLLRADLARPAFASGDATRTLLGFVVPQGISGSWKAGAFARQMSYSPDDTLLGTALLNPDNLPALPLASTWGTPDAMMHIAEVDGFTRQIDELGNVTRARLAVRLPNNPEPVFVAATLHYNVLGQLSHVVRDDGVVIVNEYTPGGLRMRRQISGPASLCVPSDTAFIYDGDNLIEERDLLNGGRVTARYYYGDEGDELVAADLLVGSELQRHYFLSDVVRSVLALTDAQANVVERMTYDTWGQPWITSADNQKPVVSRVWRESNSVFVAFSETVLPTFASTSTSNLITQLRGVDSAFELRLNGSAAPVQVTFAENHPGFAFGSVFQLSSSATLTGDAELRVAANSLQDEANNAVNATTININLSSGNPLFTGPAHGSTAAAVLARSSSSFLFQGQMFDFESGLLYCRARFYDPYTAQFLQRDPAGYEAGVNQYAAFAHNPISMRDPSGAFPVAYEIGESVRQWGSEMAEKHGPAGKFANFISKGVAWGLSLGTETAEGWEMLHSNNQGIHGLKDRMRGASLIQGDVMKAGVVGGTVLVAGSATVGKLQGFAQGLAARSRAYQMERTIERSGSMGQMAARRKMMKYGVTDIEGEALLFASEKTGLTAHIRYNEAKAAGRIEGVLANRRQKPGFAAAFKSDPDGVVRFEVSATDMRGNVITRKHEYVSDLDMWGFTKNGRLATPAESARFERVFQQKFAELKKLRGMEALDTPLQHPAQIELGTTFGGLSGGKKVTQQLMQKIGHPGDVFAIRPATKGRFYIDQTPETYVQHMIDMAEPALKQLQIKQGLVPLGFPANWRQRK
jgi:RHS repeat-associated protein